jgi:hypothetical protein
MSTVTTIGLDIAKSVFQVHGISATDEVLIRRQVRRGQVLKFFAALPDRDRGLCLGSSLVARTPEPGPSGETHAAGLRQTLREAAEERHG